VLSVPERTVLVTTDYLVVGSGASGLAFVDALVAEVDVEVTVIDRRRAPGRSLAARVRARAASGPCGSDAV
jgi:ribulose 1,5-bisphosphate synthetase/thiazole synthase